MAPNVAIIGSGTIGLSFAALHLTQKPTRVTIYDPRPDLHDHVQTHLPQYLASTWPAPPTDDGPAPTAASLLAAGRLVLSPDLATAVADADIVQEQGPENVDFKQSLWPQIEAAAPASALFWSSTSGIPASVQAQRMQDPARLLVVHPFNPPHVMPLLELVLPPSAQPAGTTADPGDDQEDRLARTLAYWRALGREPAVLHEEIAGFVANRLAAALFREAAYLVDRGVADAATIDSIVEQSMGPRWAVRGPFWSYHAGGGRATAGGGHPGPGGVPGGVPGGLRGLLTKVPNFRNTSWLGQLPSDRSQANAAGFLPWEETIIAQTEAAYGPELGDAVLRDRDEKLKKVLDATRR